LKKNDKAVIFFYIFLAISFTGVIFYFDSMYPTTELLDILPKPVKELEIITETKIEKNKIFLIMTDLENYPKVLMNNIKSVKILEQTNSTIIAEFDVIEKGISSKLTAKQTIYPYSKHVMEVIEGDAKGTKVTQIFSEKNLITTINTKVDLNLEGILSVFGYLPKNNLEHAANSVVTSFVTYAKVSDSETKKIIDDLYREILLRPADNEALEYWSPLLKNNVKTMTEIRAEITNSEEKRLLTSLQQIKDVDELKTETKKIIDDLYREILLRPADNEALEYWGSLLENKNFDELEIRKSILKSDEAIDLKRFDRTASKLSDLYEDIFKREIYYPELIHYKYLVDIEELTINEIKLELEIIKNEIDSGIRDEAERRFVENNDK
jgi:ribosome-associated toxin RatA of RatAB toxin-antitoxin module